MPDASPAAAPLDAVPPAVRTSLRSHLARPRTPHRLYEEVRDRCHGAEADVVRRHRVTGDGACASCGRPVAADGAPGGGAVPCDTLLGLAHDLGLHLRLTA